MPTGAGAPSWGTRLASAARIAVAAGAAAVLVAACHSPEASRSRGTGPGADVGNRGRVELHGGSQIYYDTPVLIGTLARGEVGALPASSR